MIRTENRDEKLFKVFFDVDTDEEQSKVWCQLVDEGYDGSEVIRSTWQGTDRFHREVFVWNR